MKRADRGSYPNLFTKEKKNKKKKKKRADRGIVCFDKGY